MTVFYIDPIGGNNSNNGLSFANRKKHFQSGDINSVDQSGDEIRFMKTPDPASLGNGTWTASTGKVANSGYYGRIQQTGTFTKGNPTVIDFTDDHNLTTGDLIEINITSALTNSYTTGGIAGLYKCTVTDSNSLTIPVDSTSHSWNDDTTTAVWYNHDHAMVKLAATDVVKSVAHGSDQGYYRWEPATNISHSTSNQPYIGRGSLEHPKSMLNVSGDFTSGKMAHTALPSTMDLSAYEQISFQFASENNNMNNQGNSGQLADGLYELRLCSDNNGDTAVHTIPIVGGGGRNQRYSLIQTKDFGTALSNNINSVALYATADISDAHYITCRNIIACKDSSNADSITLEATVSKSNSATNAGEWYPLAGIWFGQYLALGYKTSYGIAWTSSQFGYMGTTETVTTYWRHTPCLKGDQVTHSFYGNAINFGGSNASDNMPDGITISGGWNTTDMSTRTGMSFYQGSALYHQNFLYQYYQGYSKLKHFGTFGFYHHVNQYTEAKTDVDNCVWYISQYGLADHNGLNPCTMTNSWFMYDGNQWQDDWGGTGTKATNCKFIAASYLSKSSSGKPEMTLENCDILSCSSHISNNNNGGNTDFINCTFDDMYGKALSANSQQGTSELNFIDCTFGNRINSTNWPIDQNVDDEDVGNLKRKCTFTNYNDVSGDHRTYWLGGALSSETSVRHTASGLAWKISPTTAYFDADKPLSFNIAEVFCNSGAAVTATLWVRRSNTGITIKLAATAANNAISSDVTDSAAAAADTWEQLSITFTPTKAQPAKIDVLVYGGTTYSAYIDDFGITQA
tara:strand:+ start:1127 stop:3520 length:2394 start_codon:yes stop_codon:yes gene_type:complete